MKSRPGGRFYLFGFHNLLSPRVFFFKGMGVLYSFYLHYIVFWILQFVFLLIFIPEHFVLQFDLFSPVTSFYFRLLQKLFFEYFSVIFISRFHFYSQVVI